MTEDQTPGTELVLVPTRQGEAVALVEATTDVLADALDWLIERQRRDKAVVAAVRAEIAGRLRKENVRTHVAGAFRVSMTTGRSRVWDADELEGVLADLVERDVVSAGAVAEIVTHPAPKVDGTLANRLATSVEDPADREAIEACFRWESNTPTVKVEAVDAEATS